MSDGQVRTAGLHYCIWLCIPHAKMLMLRYAKLLVPKYAKMLVPRYAKQDLAGTHVCWSGRSSRHAMSSVNMKAYRHDCAQSCIAELHHVDH